MCVLVLACSRVPLSWVRELCLTLKGTLKRIHVRLIREDISISPSNQSRHNDCKDDDDD